MTTTEQTFRETPAETPCFHCGNRRATWCEALCSDCASLTLAEQSAFLRTHVHPRMPQA